MSDSVKIKKSIVFVAILAASLTFTQFQTMPVSALEFSITKVPTSGTDRFGWSVQQLDNGFAVGEPFADPNDSGLVYIFDSNGDLVDTITNPDGADNHFGYSLSALGSTLAVGAPGHSNNKGMVYLYDTSDTATPQSSITNPSGNNDERMGEDEMNFLGGDLLVGVSKAENDGNSQAGIIYLFSSSDGSLLGDFSNPSGTNEDDLFGRSISVDDVLFMSGAHGAVGGEGETYVIGGPTDIIFENPNLGSPQDDKYGWSTDITPTRYVVGAPHAEVEHFGTSQIVQQGAVYLHHRNDPGTDVITSPDLEDVALSQNVIDQFGYDISSSNGLILVGAPYDDVEMGGTTYIDAGSVYLYDDEGSPFATLHNPDPADNDLFGYSLDIRGYNLLIGAPGDEGDTGAVYVASCELFCASLTIEADPNPVTSGAPLTITYTVKNEGMFDFLAPVVINIVDPTCSSILGPFDDAGQDGIMEAKEEWTFTCEKTAPASDFTESVDLGQTLITFSPDGEEEQVITCEEQEFHCGSAQVDILETALTLEISAEPDTIYTGQTSDVTFTVINEGNDAIFIDGATGIVDENENCEPVADILDVITLESQASVDFTCTVTGGTSQINFVATATAGIDQDDPTGITATDTLTVNVLAPAITLDISADPDPTYDGEDTIITYNVTNTGNSPVIIDEQTDVTENLNPDCTPITQTTLPITLQPNDFVIFTCTVTAGISPISFSATATATAGNGPISDTDTLTVNIIAPAITLNISSNPNPVNSGSISLITYNVTNTGNSPITIDGETGVLEQGTNGCVPFAQVGTITLQPNDVATFTCTITAGISPINFDAIATADDENGREVPPAAAQHTLDVIPNILLSGIIRDFKISHPDFQYKISDDDGIVKVDLGDDGEPLYNGNPFTGTITTTGLVNYNQWYNHVNTVNDCIQYDITLVPSITNPGYFTYMNPSFFPIDGQLFGNEGNSHNYHFTYQIHATFVYQLGQTITMTGDDDVWVFINDKLALDQGGVLPPRTGTINLGTLGLTPGQTYSFDLFFAERHTVQSNLGIETNIPLIQSTPGECKAVDAVNDSVFTTQGPNTIPVTSNDVGFSSISTFTQGMHGSVSQIGTSLVYTPTLGFEGIDLFTYSITNTSGSTDTAVVTVIALTDATCPLPVSSYNIIMGDDNNNKLKGTNGNDLILGNGGDDKIYGKKGNDCLIGGNGNDKIWGGDGNDTMISGSGNDQVHGQQGDDTMFGGSGDDKIYGSKGNDTIDAGTGNDRVHANQDNDTVLGGDGNDWLGAGIGNDIVYGGTGNDNIFGRPGNDILNGDAGDDLIYGGQGDDTANGGDNNDKIYGHQGNDILNGNNNDDYIHGGQGNDALDGGNGNDKCNGAQGTNTIVNCEAVDNKMKEEQEENDDDEGESEDDTNDDKDKKDKKDK